MCELAKNASRKGVKTGRSFSRNSKTINRMQEQNLCKIVIFLHFVLVEFSRPKYLFLLLFFYVNGFQGGPFEVIVQKQQKSTLCILKTNAKNVKRSILYSIDILKSYLKRKLIGFSGTNSLPS